MTALRAHLDTLLPILDGRAVPGASGFGSTPAETTVPGASPRVPVLLGALGPVMLQLAGERASGTIVILSGPRTIGDHVVPRLVRAAEGAGRPRPRVVVGLPAAVTAQPQRVRDEVSAAYAGLARLASYAATLRRDGLDAAGDLAVVGDEQTVTAALRRYADLGATDLLASLAGNDEERERTLELLGAHAAATRDAQRSASSR